jgi:hypothetical protein
MCLAVFKTCECGTNTVQFHLRDNLLQPEALSRLFCPSCPGDTAFDETVMIADNGWVIEYDMVFAKGAMARQNRVEPEQVNPGYIFDQGYCTWLETYPGEQEDIKEEKQKLLKLRDIDQQRYLKEIIAWNVNRLKELKAGGWRKAQAA